ncbi:hypothetical protein K457DRAFT_127470 [Linnemannia elongata AG-77]|uniref:Uncharacterized protein n=1 Tax=Linnemannia elongata AG-77 TaxID=1314771 RepID=A0A197JQ45_9FUNG|nr:hypothetical protein K457DRAFT_127470 [Linnemannia elongata AG-77]
MTVLRLQREIANKVGMEGTNIYHSHIFHSPTLFPSSPPNPQSSLTTAATVSLKGQHLEPLTPTSPEFLQYQGIFGTHNLFKLYKISTVERIPGQDSIPLASESRHLLRPPRHGHSAMFPGHPPQLVDS